MVVGVAVNFVDLMPPLLESLESLFWKFQKNQKEIEELKKELKAERRLIKNKNEENEALRKDYNHLLDAYWAKCETGIYYFEVNGLDIRLSLLVMFCAN
ncbi:22800_t:CDS:2 [Dentiscutata erythropus]|uniref:22800_t:CDS:1 n=1 Tax=Dentiscutata erythropus TaxID=1348616 RepID=A0A9N9I5M4_9GLOM|nr:22800_t:CDS:2 [Dentiscutata erythropus]